MDESSGLAGREEADRKVEQEEAGDGFQVVRRKKSKQGGGSNSASGSASGRMVAKDKAAAAAAAPWAKAKVPFHDPSIPRPQDVYTIIVNNSNLPFDHVWLAQSEDGTRRIHPLENLPVEQFVDRNVPESEPVKPADLEDTPFTLVEDKNGLAELAKKLRSVNEFAVDLEHNQYRSFQGLTCLMQISTRTEDFLVDTLKLRIFVGLYLQEFFKDPTKRKVMHGADRDIVWLQRDFRIYVCNLFDTGQASRVLQMERNSLEHLLQHFCGVTANKEYQNADWRSRPLSDEMIKYAREDTHYLLYIYDLMRIRLQRESTCENDLLLEVQKRSNEICLQLYEKELLTDTSYLHIYGLQEHELNAKQLSVLCDLHQWRDCVAREKDESTGYVLPNKALIDIAKRMPTDTAELKRIVKSKYPFVDDNLDVIVGYVLNASENSYAFESVAEQLRNGQLEQVSGVYTGASPLDADNDRRNSDAASQSFVPPSSTANIGVTLDNRSMSEAPLISHFGSIQLEDNVQTISSPEMKTYETLSSLIKPVNKEMLSDKRLKQAQNEMFKHSSAPAFYPQPLPGYSTQFGLSYHQPEGMLTFRPPYGSEHSFEPINQRSTATGQPPSHREGDIHGPGRRQSFPPAGFSKKSDTHQ